MMADKFVWFVASCVFLAAWLALYVAFPGHRRVMFRTSVFTMPLGLTQPFFVPEYWNPPSLFDLAQRTGFDIESLVFCFAIGGIGAVLYNILSRRQTGPIAEAARHPQAHRFHRLVLALPLATFLLLVLLPWNPIYPGILAMSIGAGATIWCRPDLKEKTWIGGILFLSFYTVLFQILVILAPGYIKRVWNLNALLGFTIASAPIEELLFALAFGMYWSGVYEHFTWQTVEYRDPTSSTGS